VLYHKKSGEEGNIHMKLMRHGQEGIS